MSAARAGLPARLSNSPVPMDATVELADAADAGTACA